MATAPQLARSASLLVLRLTLRLRLRLNLRLCLHLRPALRLPQQLLPRCSSSWRRRRRVGLQPCTRLHMIRQSIPCVVCVYVCVRAGVLATVSGGLTCKAV